MAFTNPSDSIVIPSDAGPNDPQIVIGSDIPADLQAYFNSITDIIHAVIILRFDANTYQWIALAEDPALPQLYRLDGSTNPQGAPSPVPLIKYVHSNLSGAQILIGDPAQNPGGGENVEIYNRLRVDDKATFAADVSLTAGKNNLIGTDSIVHSSSHSQLFSQNYAGTTDASGFLTVTHSAPFTPSRGWYITANPAASFAVPWGMDNFTATTVRLRVMNGASGGGGGLASSAISGYLFLMA